MISETEIEAKAEAAKKALAASAGANFRQEDYIDGVRDALDWVLGNAEEPEL